MSNTCFIARGSPGPSRPGRVFQGQHAEACEILYNSCIETARVKLKGIVQLSSLAAVGPSLSRITPWMKHSPCHPGHPIRKIQTCRRGDRPRHHAESIPIVILRPSGGVRAERDKHFHILQGHLGKDGISKWEAANASFLSSTSKDLIGAMVHRGGKTLARRRFGFFHHRWQRVPMETEVVRKTATHPTECGPRSIRIPEKFMPLRRDLITEFFSMFQLRKRSSFGPAENDRHPPEHLDRIL